jgi:hypothetical protein
MALLGNPYGGFLGKAIVVTITVVKTHDRKRELKPTLVD